MLQVRLRLIRNTLAFGGTGLGGRDVLAVAGIDQRIKAVVSQTPLIKWTPSVAAQMVGFGGDLVRYHQELAEDHQDRT